jgi:hypothetical protein
MKSFKTWLEDYDPRDDIPGGSYKFEVEEIGYVDNRPAIPVLPSQGEDKEVYQVVYDLSYEMTPGMKGHTSKADFGAQMTPDDPDEYEITHNDPIEVNHEKLDGNHPILKTFNITLNELKEILLKYFHDHLHDEALEQVEDHGV